MAKKKQTKARSSKSKPRLRLNYTPIIWEIDGNELAEAFDATGLERQEIARILKRPKTRISEMTRPGKKQISEDKLRPILELLKSKNVALPNEKPPKGSSKN